ncbi:MAG: DEAD/DEAH box helicase [Proteobacteria bacterium]|nr:DEAD/DEAH box helicase [Pseudomonadota bacterium]
MKRGANYDDSQSGKKSRYNDNYNQNTLLQHNASNSKHASDSFENTSLFSILIGAYKANDKAKFDLMCLQLEKKIEQQPNCVLENDKEYGFCINRLFYYAKKTQISENKLIKLLSLILKAKIADKDLEWLLSSISPATGFTPLHSAILIGSEHILDFLLKFLEKCPDVLSICLATKSNGHSTLNSAIQTKNPKLVRMMLEALAKHPDILKNCLAATLNSYTVLDEALNKADLESLQLILEYLSRYPSMLKICLENTATGYRPLYSALIRGGASLLLDYLELPQYQNALILNLTHIQSRKFSILHNLVSKNAIKQSETTIQRIFTLGETNLPLEKWQQLLTQLNTNGYSALDYAFFDSNILFITHYLAAFKKAFGNEAQTKLKKLFTLKLKKDKTSELIDDALHDKFPNVAPYVKPTASLKIQNSSVQTTDVQLETLSSVTVAPMIAASSFITEPKSTAITTKSSNNNHQSETKSHINDDHSHNLSYQKISNSEYNSDFFDKNPLSFLLKCVYKANDDAEFDLLCLQLEKKIEQQPNCVLENYKENNSCVNQLFSYANKTQISENKLIKLLSLILKAQIADKDLEWLLSSVSPNSFTPLHSAILIKNEHVLAFLLKFLEKHPRILSICLATKLNDTTVLGNAILTKNQTLLRMILEVLAKHPDILKMCLTNTINNYTVLDDVFKKKELESLQLILEYLSHYPSILKICLENTATGYQPLSNALLRGGASLLLDYLELPQYQNALILNLTHIQPNNFTIFHSLTSEKAIKQSEATIQRIFTLGETNLPLEKWQQLLTQLNTNGYSALDYAFFDRDMLFTKHYLAAFKKAFGNEAQTKLKKSFTLTLKKDKTSELIDDALHGKFPKIEPYIKPIASLEMQKKLTQSTDIQLETLSSATVAPMIAASSFIAVPQSIAITTKSNNNNHQSEKKSDINDDHSQNNLSYQKISNAKYNSDFFEKNRLSFLLRYIYQTNDNAEFDLLCLQLEKKIEQQPNCVLEDYKENNSCVNQLFYYAKKRQISENKLIKLLSLILKAQIADKDLEWLLSSSQDGFTPLRSAILIKNKHVLAFLLKFLEKHPRILSICLATKFNEHTTILNNAILTKKPTLLRMILEVLAKHPDILKMCLTNKINNYTVLDDAVQKKEPENLQLILEYLSRYPSILKICLENTATGYQPLCNALFRGDASLLLDYLELPQHKNALIFNLAHIQPKEFNILHTLTNENTIKQSEATIQRIFTLGETNLPLEKWQQLLTQINTNGYSALDYAFFDRDMLFTKHYLAAFKKAFGNEAQTKLKTLFTLKLNGNKISDIIDDALHGKFPNVAPYVKPTASLKIQNSSVQTTDIQLETLSSATVPPIITTLSSVKMSESNMVMPAATVTTPAATVTTPAATVTTPAATVTTPAATVTTPAATVTTPAATVTTPAATVTIPVSIVASNAPALAALPQSQNLLSEKKSKPVSFKATPIETPYRTIGHQPSKIKMKLKMPVKLTKPSAKAHQPMTPTEIVTPFAGINDKYLAEQSITNSSNSSASASALEHPARYQLMPLDRKTALSLKTPTVHIINNPFLQANLYTYREPVTGEQAITFVCAGRKENALIPKPEKGRCICILTQAEWGAMPQAQQHQILCRADILAVESIQSPLFGQYEARYILGRRLAIFLAAAHWQLNHFIMMDDNVYAVSFNDGARVTNAWDSFYEQLQLQLGREPCVSVTRHYSQEAKPGQLGSKLFFIDWQKISAKLQTPADIFLLFPCAQPQHSWGEDYFMQLRFYDLFTANAINEAQGFRVLPKQVAVLERAQKHAQAFAKMLGQGTKILATAFTPLAVAGLNEAQQSSVNRTIEIFNTILASNQARFEAQQNLMQTQVALPAQPPVPFIQPNALAPRQFVPALKAIFSTVQFKPGTLRPYQQKAITAIGQKPGQHLQLDMTTGSGKSLIEVTMAQLAYQILQPGEAIVVITSTIQLTSQLHESFLAQAQKEIAQQFSTSIPKERIFAISSGNKHRPVEALLNDIEVVKNNKNVFIFCIDSFMNLLEVFPNFLSRVRVMMLDECHKYDLNVTKLKSSALREDLLMTGFSATPVSTALTTVFKYKHSEGVKQGYLAPIILDKLTLESGALLLGSNLLNLLNQTYHPGNADKSTLATNKGILYLPSIEDCNTAHQLLTEANFTAYAIHSKNPQRYAEIEAFKQSDQGLLISCEMCQEGLDDPSISYIIIDKNCNEDTIIQIAGRTARQKEDKVGYVLARPEAYVKILPLIKQQPPLPYPLDPDYLGQQKGAIEQDLQYYFNIKATKTTEDDAVAKAFTQKEALKFYFGDAYQLIYDECVNANAAVDKTLSKIYNETKQESLFSTPQSAPKPAQTEAEEKPTTLQKIFSTHSFRKKN